MRADLPLVHWPEWVRATSSHGAAAEMAEREAFEEAAGHLRNIRARGAMRQRMGPARAAEADRKARIQRDRDRLELEFLAAGLV